MMICKAVRSRAIALSATFLLLAPAVCSAQLLEIIHTNDLHSHMDHAENPAQGGYAAVKAVIERLRSQAAASGTDTLVLDAGDFSEGTQYFLADRGADSWRAMSAMGYDAVTIGNHDWLLGLGELDALVGRVQPSFPLLGANFIFDGSRHNLAAEMRPYVEFTKAGSRIAVLGLTTDDTLYSWAVSPGFIEDPLAEARTRLKELRKRDDFVIALTHIGVGGDVRLAQNTRGLDLIVGGHSHTMLMEPIRAANQDGKAVPIVQTGKHGEYVGDLLVDVVPGQPLKIVHYRLVPVYSSGPKDADVSAAVQEARDALDGEYGYDWLREVVGSSDIPLENAFETGRPSVWGAFVSEGMRETAGSDLALDVSEFSGTTEPPGQITREELFSLYPRVSDVNHRYGWTVWRVTIRGWLLKIVINEVYKHWIPMNHANISFDVSPSDNSISDVKINGDDLHWWKNYTVSVPEGLVTGAYGITSLLKLVLKDPHDTQVPIWFSSERHLRENGPVHAPRLRVEAP